VGAGGSQEAAYNLLAPIPAGTYRLVLDAIVIHSVDVTFDLIWRSGGDDTTLAEWTAHYDPLPAADFSAQPFEYDLDGQGVVARDGDQLVFRYAADAASPADSYIPNGDGAKANGRIPSITLPR